MLNRIALGLFQIEYETIKIPHTISDYFILVRIEIIKLNTKVEPVALNEAFIKPQIEIGLFQFSPKKFMN